LHEIQDPGSPDWQSGAAHGPDFTTGDMLSFPGPIVNLPAGSDPGLANHRPPPGIPGGCPTFLLSKTAAHQNKEDGDPWAGEETCTTAMRRSRMGQQDHAENFPAASMTRQMFSKIFS
jgi:hypothetical protein